MNTKRQNDLADDKLIIEEAVSRMISYGAWAECIEALEAGLKRVPKPAISTDDTLAAFQGGYASYRAGVTFSGGDALPHSERHEWRKGWLAAANYASIGLAALDDILLRREHWHATLVSASTVMGKRIGERTPFQEKKHFAMLSDQLEKLANQIEILPDSREGSENGAGNAAPQPIPAAIRDETGRQGAVR